MKNLAVLIAWIGLAWAFVHPSDALGQEPGGFDFLCRGPFQVRTLVSNNTETTSHGALQIDFIPNSEAAGFQGGSLRAGRCAWVDRPVNESEPHHVAYLLTWPTGAEEQGGAEITYPFYIPSHLGASIIIQCAQDSRCILEFHNVENREGFELVPQNPTVIRYVR